MQAQNPSSSAVEAITPPLTVGDKVSYVAMTGGGREYRLSARTGMTLLSEAGETFMLSNVSIWVQPVAIALSMAQQEVGV